MTALAHQNPRQEKIRTRGDAHRRFARASHGRIRQKCRADYDATSSAPKFANGAVTAAFARAFNDEVHRPRGRGITSGEKSLGESVYQDSIDYGKVRIINGKYSKLQADDVIMTPDGNMYAPQGAYSADYSLEDLNSKGLFIHELGHVLQHQEGINVEWEGLKILMSGGYSEKNLSRTYGVSERANYLDVNIEQQAELWRMLYLERHAAGMAP